jgi:mono/diheme cytochrome c family protein
MKFILKTVGGLIGLILVVAITALLAFEFKSGKHHPIPKLDIHEDVAKADVELGKRIYFVRAGCVECHGENLAGRLVVDNPAIGRITGANLTPHKLKDWSDDQIAAAVRYGLARDGRSLRFMPSMDYSGLSRSDTAALIAFVRSVPAVENAAEPSNSFGPVAKIMSVLGKMPVIFPAEAIDQKKPFEDKPAEGPTHEFGRYLARSCTGCHGENFGGGPIPGGDPSWPLASDIRLGQNAAWTEETFTNMLKSGISPLTQKELRAPMPVAQLKQLNEMESKALWTFLSSLK